MGNRGEAVAGLRATRERGLLLPLPTDRRPASAPRTAHRCRSRGRAPLGLQGSEARARLLTPLRCAPQTLPVFLFTSCVYPPTHHPRQVRSLKQAADRAGTLRKRDGGGVKRGWGTKVPPGKRAQARRTAGLLSPPQLTDPSSPGRGIRPWLQQRAEK